MPKAVDPAVFLRRPLAPDLRGRVSRGGAADGGRTVPSASPAGGPSRLSRRRTVPSPAAPPRAGRGPVSRGAAGAGARTVRFRRGTGTIMCTEPCAAPFIICSTSASVSAANAECHTSQPGKLSNAGLPRSFRDRTTYLGGRRPRQIRVAAAPPPRPVHGRSASRPRRCREWTLSVAAAASPRLVH